LPENKESTFTPWLPEKTEAEKKEILQKMRAAEVKWAKRCLAALVVLLGVGATSGLLVWLCFKNES
jgi:hypothetical protein